jgi:hypothetical protein
MSSLAGGAFSLMGGAQGVAEEVQQQAQDIQQKMPQLQQKAQEVKPQATRAAWATFGALLLSLAAAVIGAAIGRRRAPGAYPSSSGT